MTVSKADFHGDPNVGLYGFVTDRYAIVPDKNIDTSCFKVPIIYSTIAQTELVGLFAAGNSNGLIVPRIITEREEDRLMAAIKKVNKSINFLKLDANETCIGNLILCNDNVAIVSPLIENYADLISKCLKVPVVTGKILDLEIIGSLCVATNKGFLLTINGSEEDFEFLKKNLKVNGDIGTVNFGGAFVKSGIIANSHAALIGKLTTGPESARIEEALGFLEE